MQIRFEEINEEDPTLMPPYFKTLHPIFGQLLSGGILTYDRSLKDLIPGSDSSVHRVYCDRSHMLASEVTSPKKHRDTKVILTEISITFE